MIEYTQVQAAPPQIAPGNAINTQKKSCCCKGEGGGIVIYLDRAFITFFIIWVLMFLIKKIAQ